MQVRNNYNECPTNLACSIRKYFDLPYHHNTLDFIDRQLEENQPEKVIVLVLDGLGTNILERNLPEDAFLRRNLQKSITTVCAATTAAATLSLRMGLNPVEHGLLGWTFYVEPLDKIILPFIGVEKGKEDKPCNEFTEIKKQLMGKTITSEINANGKYHSKEVAVLNSREDFLNYTGLDTILNGIRKELAKPGKSYIYAHDLEPDVTMHKTGTDSPEVQALIEERNRKLEQFTNELTDTLLIILADHGHLNTKHIFLKDYPEIVELLARPISLDQRTISFKVKNGRKEQFRQTFERLLGADFDLYDAEDVITSKLFGDGEENPLYRPAIGDFIAISKGKQCLIAPEDHIQKSCHAGYSDDEIFIPIITKYCK